MRYIDDEDLSKPKSLNKCKYIYIMISVDASNVVSKPLTYFLNDEEDIQTIYDFWGYSKKTVLKIIENVMALSSGECYIHKINNYDYELFSCVN